MRRLRVRRDVVRPLATMLLLIRYAGLDRRHPFSTLAALRPQMAAVVLATGMPRRSAPFWVRASAVPSHLLATGVLARVLERAHANGSVPPRAHSLTLLLLNARDGRADADALASAALDSGAGLMALTEAGSHFTARVMERLGPDGFRSWSSVDDDRRDVDGVALIAAPSVGEVQVRRHPETWFPHLEVRCDVLGELRLIVFHAVAPIPPGSAVGWVADHERIARWCRKDCDVIVAGDLNSTLDHSILCRALGSARDAAAEAGAGLVATWPASLPRWAGLQLDHVLVPECVGVGQAQVIDIPGTDHRALVVQLSLPYRGPMRRSGASGAE